jgi:hypothetical protein
MGVVYQRAGRHASADIRACHGRARVETTGSLHAGGKPARSKRAATTDPPVVEIFPNLQLRVLSKTDNLQNIEPEGASIVLKVHKSKAVSYRGSISTSQPQKGQPQVDSGSL